MADDRQKPAGEAAKEKVERREGTDVGADAADAESERDPRSPQERAKDLAAGSIEPEGIKPTEEDLSRSPEELREDVEAAREQLAGTVEELTEKLDPRPNIEEARQRAGAQAASARQRVEENIVPIAAAAGLLLLLLIWFRRR